jgi:hypothetical protein
MTLTELKRHVAADPDALAAVVRLERHRNRWRDIASDKSTRERLMRVRHEMAVQELRQVRDALEACTSRGKGNGRA